MDDLKDRLRREWQAFPAFGSGSVAVNHDGTLISSKSCITDSGMRLVNPDGPEAANRIEALEAGMRKIAKCALSTEARRIARAALAAAEREA